MIAIQISNASLILGARVIFRDLTWEIPAGQKIGLIGPNGAGKSSLFKLISGEYKAEPGGGVVFAKGITAGYLAQEPGLDSQRSAHELAMEGRPRWAVLESELERLEASLGDPGIFNQSQALERALAAHEASLQEYEALGGSSFPGRVDEMLRGLGLPEPDLSKPAGVLSGGQKKLIGLARLLLGGPDVLLLDEPDNHLDLPGKAYLEKMIRNYPGAVVLVSHDRYLLDACVNQITEIENGRLTVFKGNYTEYILDKQERQARQEELFEIQQRSIQRMEQALRRYRLWVQTSDKFASRVHAMEKRLERIERIESPERERRRMGLELNGWRGSNNVLMLEGVGKSFGSLALLKDINLLIRHGERVGLIGANGSGKSVLMRLMLGMQAADRGEVRLGPSVRVGYYAQEHETLNPNLTLAESVRNIATMSESNTIAFLVRYLFSYEQASMPVRTLSGGERSRLQLALLVLSGANFLLLDEPTNNLDIASAEVLENALADFIGTVLVISHDRYFLDRTVGRILALEGGRLKDHAGNFSDYMEGNA